MAIAQQAGSCLDKGAHGSKEIHCH